MDNATDLDKLNDGNPESKTLTQERVNEIVKREKAAAADKARREMQAEIDSQKNSIGMGGMAAPDSESIYNDVKARLMQDLEQQQQESRVKGLVDKFYTGMDKGKDFAPDFDTITAEFNPSAFPQLVTLVATRDDLAPLMYELAKNPIKAANLDMLAQRDPNLAMKQLEILSGSIKANQEAERNNPKVNPPLSHLKPSISAGADDGEMSLRDLKKIYRG